MTTYTDDMTDTGDLTDSSEYLWILLLTSSAGATDAAAFSSAWLLSDTAAGSATASINQHLTSVLHDAGVAVDLVSVGFTITSSSSAVGADTLVSVLTALEQIVEAATAADAVVNPARLTDVLSVAVIGADGATFGYLHSLSDSGAAASTLTVLRTLINSLIDSGAVTAEVSGHAAVSIALTENIVAADTLVVNQVISELLGETAVVHAYLSIGGELYDAWVLNTESGGVTEYENYAFNSYARFNGKYIAAGEGGIYELGGDDDDGDPIEAYLRTGLTNLGTAIKKRVPAAYFGYTSSGQLVAKVITTDEGVKRENWYELTAVQRDATSDGRVTPAKGLSSTYWAFEVANLDGSDFSLETVRVWRMVLNRRK